VIDPNGFGFGAEKRQRNSGHRLGRGLYDAEMRCSTTVMVGSE